MKKLLLLLTLIGFSSQAISQINIDSLRTNWEDSSLEMEMRMESAIRLVIAYNNTYRQSDSAISIARAAYKLAKAEDLTSWQARFLLRQGYAYQNLRQGDEAIKHFEQSMQIWRELGDSLEVAYSLNSIGVMYEDMEKLEEAIHYLTLSVPILDSLDRPSKLANSLICLGRVEMKRGNYPQAIENNLAGLKIAEQEDHKQLIGVALSNMGIIYNIQGDYNRAIELYKRSFELDKERNDSVGMAGDLVNLGSAYQEQDSNELALDYYQRGLEMCQRVNHPYYLSNALSGIGMTYFNLEKLDKAESHFRQALAIKEKFGDMGGVAYALNGLALVANKEENYYKAIELGERALKITKEIGYAEQIVESAWSLFTAYWHTDQPRKAMYMQDLYNSKMDSIAGEKARQEVLRQEYEYEYEKQALQDSLAFVQQQAEIEVAYERQLAERNYLLFGGLALALIGFLFLRYRQQLRTRQKELELQREREHKEQLAELDAIKSRFFANISHEFRTPLTLILGQNQSLQATVDEPSLDPKFEMVDRNGRRLMELINQVLDLSKLETGKLSWNPETLDLIPFLKNQLSSFESLADQKMQELNFVGAEKEVLLVADPEKLERVFYNLLSNAIKFTPQKGKIELLLEKSEDQIRIGVKDSGIGLSEEDLPYIFDRFYQANGGDSNPSPGTGIGLALVKELVELHQGMLEVESEIGQGSTFWVCLPLEPGLVKLEAISYTPALEPLAVIESLHAQPKQVVSSPDPHKHILIVEDNPDVRAYLREELEGQGYHVTQAVDGREGISLAKQEQPDLIISDVMMPKTDGFELAEAIRADTNSSHIPLILLTAKASEESRITGLQIGIDDYLTKPFSSRELQVRVANLIEQRHRLRQRFSESLTIKAEEVSAVPMDQQFLQLVTSTIEARMTDEQFSVEGLSEIVGMSVTHLNRKLNALIGQTAGRLIRSMRMQRAADLLTKQAFTILEIAYELGFSDPNSFTRAFKKQFGVSPRQYVEGIAD
ncbi:MAG: tetratricopeptide repeat protein [Bacteroidota bacterium]